MGGEGEGKGTECGRECGGKGEGSGRGKEAEGKGTFRGCMAATGSIGITLVPYPLSLILASLARL